MAREPEGRLRCVSKRRRAVTGKVLPVPPTFRMIVDLRFDLLRVLLVLFKVCLLVSLIGLPNCLLMIVHNRLAREKKDVCE
jgi:hypothetical protein